MPDFEGTKTVILQPNDNGVPYQYEFTVCSASTANDGTLPFGHTISSIAVSAHKIDGTDVTAALIKASSYSSGSGDFVETVWLKYSTSTGIVTGKHHLMFLATIIGGTTTYVEEFNFNRVLLKDL